MSWLTSVAEQSQPVELRDRIRPDAKGIVATLHAQGAKIIVMLTGDNERTARAVAAEVGIDEVRAELLLEDKVTAIEELTARHDIVAMIGVHDAPGDGAHPFRGRDGDCRIGRGDRNRRYRA